MAKTVAIMQPYFLPYIGYWQLIDLADEFIVYDNIQYTKKGWINRNRYLHESEARLFTLPLEKASDYIDIRERSISASFNKGRLLTQIREAYRKAPCFTATFDLFESIVMFDERNLFLYLLHSIKAVTGYLDINTKITVSSHVNADHSLRASDRVLAICEAIGATRYINPIGGVKLYDKEIFRLRNIQLEFLRSEAVPYQQFGGEFAPFLSILDVLMFNGAEKTKGVLKSYTLE